MPNCSLLESGGCDLEEDVENNNNEADEGTNNEAAEDTNNEGTWCNFVDEFAVNLVTDLELINFKEMTIQEGMRCHFLDREVAYMFYN